MRTDRLQALADGVFAIALTLLVLELPLPEESSHLTQDLLHQWPFYAAYAVSFVTLGIVWVNHHRLMDGVVAADRTLLELNLLLLMFVAIVPWPTGLLAEYVRDREQSSAAAVTYGIVMMLMSASFTLIWVWLGRHPGLMRPGAGGAISSAVLRSAVGPGAYAVGIMVALVDARAAFVMFGLVAIFFALSGRHRESHSAATQSTRQS